MPGTMPAAGGRWSFAVVPLGCWQGHVLNFGGKAGGGKGVSSGGKQGKGYGGDWSFQGFGKGEWNLNALEPLRGELQSGSGKAGGGVPPLPVGLFHESLLRKLANIRNC